MESVKKRRRQTEMPSPMKRRKIGCEPEHPIRLYTQGVFDMFHHGHMRYLEQCKLRFPYVYLIAGVISDEEAYQYQSALVMSYKEREEAVKHCKWVDEVVGPCVSQISMEFVEELQIDFVCGREVNMPVDPFTEVKAAGRFLESYQKAGIDTTDLILRIVKDYDAYVGKSLRKGYQREDLNISFLKSIQIKFKNRMRSLRSSKKKRQEISEEEVSGIRLKLNNLRDSIEDLSAKSESAVFNFIGRFDKGYRDFLQILSEYF